jgi:carbonic anhydrase/acetyltransferase-like protein (isoleucine patch superfamily)
LLYSLKGLTPSVHPTAFIAPTAVLIGDVTVEAYASVWFNVILRGDAGTIVIGEGTNVQDGAILHERTIVGKHCVLAHQALVHNAVIGDRVLIGHGALVYGGATIGEGAIIGAGAVLIGPVEVPPGTVWLGVPAKQRGLADERLIEMTKRLNDSYLRNRARYISELKLIESPGNGLTDH